MTNKMKLWSLFLFLFSVSTSFAQQIYSSIFDNAMAVEAWLKELKVPALGIGIIRDGKLREITVYGELKKGEPAPYNAIFNVASLTKPVVAMLTLKLVSNGQWQLDEPLAKYWTDPDVANDPRSKKLTTRHVLSHQTGFTNWRWNNPSKKLEFFFEPGTKFQYSGEGLEYLRKAIERKFKMPIDKLVDSLVLKPLKMRDTWMGWNAAIDESRFAFWHDKDGNNAYNDHKSTHVNAADDLTTTIEDYGKFCVAVLNGFGLKQDVLSEMMKPQSTIRERDFMGLGWELITELGEQKESVILHSGSDRGVNTLAILAPATKSGLIIFTNSDVGYTTYDKLIPELLPVGKELIKMPH